MKKAAFLTPYLDVLGGAEIYLLNLAKVLNKLGYQTVFFWSDQAIKAKIIERYGEAYAFVKIDSSWQQANAFTRLLKTLQYDAFFYDTDGSYFLSLARRNYASIHVPDQALFPKKDLLSRLKFSPWRLLFNSRFTKQFYLKIDKAKEAPILNPMAESELSARPAKEKLILSIGRFFSKLHSKRQEILIKAFIKGCASSKLLSEYRLVLAGSYKEEDQKYLDTLQKLIANQPNIEIKTNLSHSEITQLYQKAKFYWHASGYGVDEKKEPWRVEHFGTTIVEAMLNYSIPLAYKAGGPREIITHGFSGYLYETPQQLINFTLELIRNNHLEKRVALASRERALEKYGPITFEKKVKELLSK